MATHPQRLLLQYLEPSPALESATTEELREHLLAALDSLPVTDLALGWELRPEVVEAVRPVIPTEIALWRWVPVFTDSGSGRPADALPAVGPEGTAPPPFGGMAEFRFLCLDHDEVIEAGLERAVALARAVDAGGVLLDRIRWHSPSRSPAAELTCFCEHSRERAARAGLDLEHVAAELRAASSSLAGRRSLVAALLGRPGSGALADFLAWRSERVSHAVEWLSDGLGEHGLGVALDVFTPALAPSTGQHLGALREHGEWAKSMTYFEALGPASMPFELHGYATWLEEAGETDAAGFLADLLGFEAPGLRGSGAQLPALAEETRRLVSAMGAERSVVGIDAVEIAGVCEVDEADLAQRVRAIRDAGVGLSPCWELLLIDQGRTRRIAQAWTAQE